MTVAEVATGVAARPSAGGPVHTAVASRSTGRRTRTVPAGVVIALGAVLVAGMAVSGAVAHLDVARDTDAAMAERGRVEVAIDAATAARLATEAELLATGRARVTAQEVLDERIADLRAAIERVASVTAIRDEAAASLAAVEGQLTETTGSVAAADSERTALQARIGSLRSCLSGVNRVLVLTAFDDHDGALRAFTTVAPSCEAAGVSQ